MAEETKSGPYTLAGLKPNPHSRPKRTRVGRGHGSGMVKTGGEGGKGQTVRSGGGKGPSFEGGQTPWARRLPQRKDAAGSTPNPIKAQCGPSTSSLSMEAAPFSAGRSRP